MSTFATSFRDEVARLARKEAKAYVKAACPERSRRATRSALADLKRRVAALEKDNRSLSTLLKKFSPLRLSASAGGSLSSEEPGTKNQEPGASRARITAKGMRSLRRKLRLSAEQFGRLLNVSGPAVYLWEKRNGPLRVRQSTRAAILSIRQLGAREAKARLQLCVQK